MSVTPKTKDRCALLHVLSGQEGRVRDRILRQVEAEEMKDCIHEVLVPTEISPKSAAARRPNRSANSSPGMSLFGWNFSRKTTN